MFKKLEIESWDEIFVFPNSNAYIKYEVKFPINRWLIVRKSKKELLINYKTSFYWAFYDPYTDYSHIVLKNKWLFPFANLLEKIRR